MTRYHRKWDRRERLLRAARLLLVEIINISDRAVAKGALRNAEVERLYGRSKLMVARIKRELTP